MAALRRRPEPALSVSCRTCYAEVGEACMSMHEGSLGKAIVGFHKGRATAALEPLRRVRALRSARDEVFRYLAIEGDL